MADINANVVVFEHGGQIKIGADTVLFVHEGTLTYSAGMEERKILRDRCVLKGALESNEQTTKLSFAVKASSTVAAGELDQLLVSRKGTLDGFAREHSIVVELPTHRGATAGKKITFAKCVTMSATRTAGTEFDLFEFQFEDMEPRPTIAALP